MRRLSPTTHRLRGTFRPDRHDPSRTLRALVQQCNWRPTRGDLRGLSAAALAFVAQARKEYVFNDRAGALVVACADTIDRMTEFTAAIRIEGAQIAGSRGRTKT